MAHALSHVGFPIVAEAPWSGIVWFYVGFIAMVLVFLALIVVEFTDLVFAADSVPAIFAITGDPFIVLRSNVFAIMGLRSLCFLLANMPGKFRFLKPALVSILVFVGSRCCLCTAGTRSTR